MYLKQYPNAIALKQTELLELRQAIAQIQENIALHENQIDYSIAFDTDLKNEAQRKVKRSELMREDVPLLDLRGQLAKLIYQRERLEIDLNCLINKFAIAKLERRAAIAQMEMEAQIAS
jgi:hypothetical protein